MYCAVECGGGVKGESGGISWLSDGDQATCNSERDGVGRNVVDRVVGVPVTDCDREQDINRNRLPVRHRHGMAQETVQNFALAAWG